MMRSLTLRISFVLFLLGFFPIYSFGQCPLNTPEFPFTTDDPFDLYSWSSNLYMPSQLGGGQTFTNVSFRLDNDFSFGNYTYSDIRVYMRHTAVTNFASDPGYPGTGGFTQVYSGGMTFNGPGIYTFNFNVAPSFVYNGSDQLEILFENRGGTDNTSEEPWFDRINDAGVGNFPGKVGWGFSFANATTISSNRRYNLQVFGISCSGFPLPVTLTSFDAGCDGDQVTLKWQTSSEVNNDYFTIERGDEQGNFEAVARVQGQGTTTTSTDYIWTDDSPQKGVYYRLSQTDFDGTTAIYNVVTSRCTDDSEIFIAPNPFSTEMQLYIAVEGTIQLMDVTGKIVLEQDIESGNNSIGTDHLENATYIARVLLKDGTEHRMTVIKQ